MNDENLTLVARYRDDGELDTTFSDDGVLTTRVGFSGGANDVAIDAKGNIVVAAGDPTGVLVMRLEVGDYFVDDDASVFEADINAIAKAGITKGCNPPNNDMFCAGEYVSRGQMAAFLNRAFGLEPSGTDWFTDDDGSTFEADINAIADAAITKGCNPPDNDMFCVGAKVTRGQMAAFLNRAGL